jgi:hypothetical protein
MEIKRKEEKISYQRTNRTKSSVEGLAFFGGQIQMEVHQVPLEMAHKSMHEEKSDLESGAAQRLKRHKKPKEVQRALNLLFSSPPPRPPSRPHRTPSIPPPPPATLSIDLF